MQRILPSLSSVRLAGLLLALAQPICAQLIWEGSDDFNDNTLTAAFDPANRWLGQGASQGTHTYSEVNQRLEFTGDNGDTGATPPSFRALFWNGGTSGADALSTLHTSWIMQSDLNLSHDASDSLVQMGIVASARNSGTAGSGSFGLYLSRNTGGTFLRATYTVTGSIPFANVGEVDLTSYGDIEDLQVRIAWDAANETFTGGYRFDSGTAFTVLGTLDADATYSLAPNGFFTNLTSRAFNGANVLAGTASFDNFSVSAVPEPAAVAAAMGLLALGLAMARRRHLNRAVRVD